MGSSHLSESSSVCVSSRLSESSADWVGSSLAESFPVKAWVGASFLANRDFLLDVLLVCVTGQASSSSRLSNWMGVASSTFSAVKAFAVCVEVWGVQVVELATLCSRCQPAVTFSGEIRFLSRSVCLARSQPSLAVVGFTRLLYRQWYKLFGGVLHLHTSHRNHSSLVWRR